jgi:heptosyltransferase-1
MRSLRSSPAPIDLARVRRVLVVKLSSFGDVVHVTPCLRAIRRACPGAEILVAVDGTWAPALRPDPHIDGVIAADPRRRRFLPSWIDARRRLARHRGPRFDLAVDFQGLSRSAAWIYASGARWRTGRGGRRPGWQLSITPDSKRHAVHVCAEVAEHIGIAVPDLEPRLFSSAAADQAIESALDAVGAPRSGFVLVNPFGRWRSKIWPAERWAALIRRLRVEVGAAVVVAGGPDEERAAQRLLALLAPAPPPSLAGKTSLAEAICLYRRAALVVSGDSGPAHAAAAVGTPVVALFGPTWPERNGPWGKSHRVIQASRASSHAAYRDDGARRHIEAIDVGTVLDAVAALYDQRRTGRARSAGGAT